MSLKRGQKNADVRKAERIEALKQFLSKQKLIEKVIETCGKLDDLTTEIQPTDVMRLKASMDARLKLINKYMPDEKLPTDINLGGQQNNPLRTIQVEYVDP